jgi:hypothetical protein
MTGYSVVNVPASADFSFTSKNSVKYLRLQASPLFVLYIIFYSNGNEYFWVFWYAEAPYVLNMTRGETAFAAALIRTRAFASQSIPGSGLLSSYRLKSPVSKSLCISPVRTSGTIAFTKGRKFLFSLLFKEGLRENFGDAVLVTVGSYLPFTGRSGAGF